MYTKFGQMSKYIEDNGSQVSFSLLRKESYSYEKTGDKVLSILWIIIRNISMNVCVYNSYKHIEKYLYVCLYIYMYVHILTLSTKVTQKQRLLSSNKHHLVTDLGFQIPFSTKRLEFLGQILILRLAEGQYRMSLEHRVGIESQEVHKSNRDVSYRSQLEAVPTGQIQDELNIKINNDHNKIITY